MIQRRKSKHCEDHVVLPDDKSIEHLQFFQTNHFVRWLLVGLKGYFLEQKGVWEFGPVGVFLGQEANLAFDLNNVYKKFRTQTQARFRQAIADLILELEINPRNFPLFENLLFLSALIPAPEILRTIPVLIGNGFFDTVRNKNGETLFGQTVTVSSELAAPTADAPRRLDALNCLHALINSGHLECAYTGSILVALCKVDPDNFANHMKIMRGPLAEMFQKFKIDGLSQQRLALQIIKALNVGAELKHLIGQLRLVNLADASPNDNWFLCALSDST